LVRDAGTAAVHIQHVMLEQLPFTFNTALCCDCISVQKQLPHVVAVGSYELLPAASPTDDNVITKTGVGGQMRAGALDFFSIDEESLHHVNHLPCAAGDLFQV
jgi:hypothetical protein